MNEAIYSCLDSLVGVGGRLEVRNGQRQLQPGHGHTELLERKFKTVFEYTQNDRSVNKHIQACQYFVYRYV